MLAVSSLHRDRDPACVQEPVQVVHVGLIATFPIPAGSGLCLNHQDATFG